MLSATFIGPYEIEARETEIPVPGHGEVLLKVYASGICGSDLAIVSGQHPRAKPPLVIGHEFSGAVTSLGAGPTGDFQIGDRVTLFPLLTCGTCYACRNGFSHVCASLRLIGFDRTGGMADYVVVPADLLVRLPADMTYETGALIEPLAVCIHAVSRTTVRPEDTVVVLGAGPIGLLTAMTLRSKGVEKIYVTDIDPFRLDIVRALRFEALDSSQSDIVAYIKDVTGGDMADRVFEVAGVQDSATQMTDLVRPRGTVVNVSVFKKQPMVDMRSVNFKELTIIGTRVYTPADYRTALDIAGTMPLREIVSHRLPLTEVAGAFKTIFNGDRVCKVLFTF
jgi:(R,R)-butanediol dehydrogenase / meso-butanediol dehydrogenase / diacetyl reductase